jgi:hypothetical protein
MARNTQPPQSTQDLSMQRSTPRSLQPQEYEWDEVIAPDDYSSKVLRFSEPEHRQYLVEVPLILHAFKIIPPRGEFVEQVYLELEDRSGLLAQMNRGILVRFPTGVMFIPDGEATKAGNQPYRMVKAPQLLEQRGE